MIPLCPSPSNDHNFSAAAGKYAAFIYLQHPVRYYSSAVSSGAGQRVLKVLKVYNVPRTLEWSLSCAVNTNVYGMTVIEQFFEK